MNLVLFAVIAGILWFVSSGRGGKTKPKTTSGSVEVTVGEVTFTEQAPASNPVVGTSENLFSSQGLDFNANLNPSAADTVSRPPDPNEIVFT